MRRRQLDRDHQDPGVKSARGGGGGWFVCVNVNVMVENKHSGFGLLANIMSPKNVTNNINPRLRKDPFFL